MKNKLRKNEWQKKSGRRKRNKGGQRKQCGGKERMTIYRKEGRMEKEYQIIEKKMRMEEEKERREHNVGGKVWTQEKLKNGSSQNREEGKKERMQEE